MGRIDFDDVRAELTAADVFVDPSHSWKTQRPTRWKGSCPWHDSESGTCFSVDPETLQWHCFSCGRGGGPLEYAAELEQVGPTAGFVEKWQALSELTGCPGPEAGRGGAAAGSPGREGRSALKRLGRAESVTEEKAPAAAVAAKPAAGGAKLSGRGPYSEAELRRALRSYRKALRTSGRAEAYLESRGLSVSTLYQLGGGYAAPGEWLADHVQNDKGTHVHRSEHGRIVTPHVRPDGRLVNLYGRAAGPGPDWLRHRHLKGPKAIFNGPCILNGSGPLVACESSLDALSFAELGHTRAVALHGKDGLPWKAMRGHVQAVVFALDTDATDEARERAREAKLRGFDTHILPAEEYAGHGDPNEALEAGALDLGYIEALESDTPQSDTLESDPEGAPEAPTPAAESAVAEGVERTDASPDDLISHWNGSIIGHLGRWIWTRPEAPMGQVDHTLRADPALHRWIARELQAGPERAGRPGRLRAVLWRLYAAFGPEGPGPPPEPGTTVQAPFPKRYAPRGSVRASYWDARRKTWRVAVRPANGLPYTTRYFDVGALSPETAGNDNE